MTAHPHQPLIDRIHGPYEPDTPTGSRPLCADCPPTLLTFAHPESENQRCATCERDAEITAAADWMRQRDYKLADECLVEAVRWQEEVRG